MPEEPNPVIKTVKRINAKTQSLLLIELPDPKIKWQVLKNTNKLHNLPKFKGTFLNADLTPEQRKQQYELRNELRRTRQNEPDKTFKIKNGKVLEVLPIQQRQQ